ncbi:MAG: efflux RND transporter periplasmic adaptor subunit [Chitinophagaceae bacterium]|nr:efflux RND transporter periplasmic adaptor subunit [Chitinophagaceae bacterium]
MKHKLNVAFTLLAFVIMMGCGSSKKEREGELNDKKAKLEKLKNEQQKLTADIDVLEKEIIALDTAAAGKEKAKLVSITELQPANFNHFIDLQGKVESDNIAYVTPRGGPGQVKAVYVKQGDAVRKGQLLLKLDDVVAQKQIDQLQTQLNFAKDIYQRQKSLWDQNIGTEVQLLTAKNNVESVEKQLSLARQQLSFSNVYAEMSGVADEVNVRVGEIFGTGPQLRIVNTNTLKVVTEVPEAYLGKVSKGTNLLITLPEASMKEYPAKVTVVGRTINPGTRTFYIEASIPSGTSLRPNQIAIVKVQDYSASNTIAIPLKTLQNDEKGKYVLVAVQEGANLVAHKRQVIVGELSGSMLEVKSGLMPGDKLITEGFQGLFEGQLITTETV